MRDVYLYNYISYTKITHKNIEKVGNLRAGISSDCFRTTGKHDPGGD